MQGGIRTNNDKGLMIKFAWCAHAKLLEARRRPAGARARPLQKKIPTV